MKRPVLPLKFSMKRPVYVQVVKRSSSTTRQVVPSSLLWNARTNAPVLTDWEDTDADDGRQYSSSWPVPTRRKYPPSTNRQSPDSLRSRPVSRRYAPPPLRSGPAGDTGRPLRLRGPLGPKGSLPARHQTGRNRQRLEPFRQHQVPDDLHRPAGRYELGTVHAPAAAPVEPDISTARRRCGLDRRIDSHHPLPRPANRSPAHRIEIAHSGVSSSTRIV